MTKIHKYYNRICKEIETNSKINNSNITYYISNITYNIDFEYNFCGEKYNVEINLTNNYPFSPPIEVNINNKEYTSNCISDPTTLNILQKYYNKHCLWCESLLCRNNWSPTITMCDIAHECINNDNIIKTIKKFSIIMKKTNKLPMDVEKHILSFCFTI